MEMINEQRLRARLAALETAHMVHGFVADGHVKGLLEIAENFETWLMRPTSIDTSTVDQGPARQSCGAFLRPGWFTGKQWLICSGRHREADGWHIDDSWPHEVTFHSHHAVMHPDLEKCACGAEIPCPNGSTKDMRA